MSLGDGNSSLGAPFALVRIFGIQQTISLVFIPKILTNTKFPPQILELDLNKKDSSESNDSSLQDLATQNRSSPNKTKSARSANPCKSFCYFLLSQKVESPYTSSLRGRIVDSPKQSKQNKCASAHRISPDSWCKKSESKGAVVPPADFLLESELRGTPPKSEKWQLLARRGSGAGGAALLRKEISKSKSKKIVGDSRITKMDSSLTAFAQNDDMVDYFGDEMPCNDGTIAFESFHNAPNSSQRTHLAF